MNIHSNQKYLFLLMLFVLAGCNSNSKNSATANDSGGTAPSSKELYIDLQYPKCTVTSWNIADNYLIALTGDDVPIMGNIDQSIKDGILTIADVYENDLPTPIGISDLLPDEGHANVLAIKTKATIKNNMKYSLILKSGTKQNSYNTLIVRDYNGSVITENAIVKTSVFTYSLPVISEVIITTEKSKGQDTIVLTFSEDINIDDILSGTPPELYFDDVQADACVSPIENCQPPSLNAYPSDPKKNIGNSRDVVFVLSDNVPLFDRVSFKMRGAIKGTSADLFTGALGMTNASRQDENIVYSFGSQMLIKDNQSVRRWCNQD